MEAERLRGYSLYKGTRHMRDEVVLVIPNGFFMKRTVSKYKAPIRQAEYAYSLIESKVK